MAAISTLVDGFSNYTVDGTKWTDVSSTGVSVVGGQLKIVDSTGDYWHCWSAASYDLRNSSVFAKVTAAPVSGSASQQTYFMFFTDASNGVGMATGTNGTGGLKLYWVKIVAGAETDTQLVATLSTTTHAWWRIRDDGSSIWFGYSSDGVSWTEPTSIARPITLNTTGYLAMYAGRFTLGDTATAFFDNINQIGRAGTETGTGTENAGTAANKKTDSDTGAGADNAGTVVQQYTGTETGTGTDSAGSVNTGSSTLSDSDTATGADNAGTVVQKYTSTETGAGADNAGTLATASTGTETGAGADNAGTLVTANTGTDTGTGTDSAGTTVQTTPKADSDTGAGADNAGTLATASTGTETGTGTDATSTSRTVGDADTGAGADNAGTVVQKYAGTDTGAGADNAGTVVQQYTGTDTGTGTDALSGRRAGDADTATGTDAGTKSVAGPVAKTGADTASAADAVVTGTVALPGAFSQIPVPKVWSNGDSLDHGTLNKEWRDTFNWLLRGTSPAFSGYNGDGASLTYTNNIAIPIKTEELKRGNLTHATNDTKVYVYETGWYMGYAQVGANYASVSSDGLKPAVVVKVNGTTAARSQTTKSTNTVAVMELQFSLYLHAGDYVEMALGNDWTGTLIGYANAYAYPFLELWWRSN